MKTRPFQAESELAAVVEKHLVRHNWEVYKEVVLPDGCRADIVAVRNNIVWIIETKNSASVAVFNQAYDRLKYAHYVSVATPIIRHGTDIVLRTFCEYYGIGWLKCWKSFPEDRCEAQYQPKLYRHRELKIVKQIDKLRKMLHPEQKESMAGTNGGHFTPYRNTMNQVRSYLAVHGPASMKDIVAKISHHYASDAGARSTIARDLMWFHKDEFVKIIDGKKVLWTLKKLANK